MTDIDTIDDVAMLERLLSEPTAATVEAMASLSGDLMLLGVGGKVGPSLARMARRAAQAAGVDRRVIGVSRFTNPELIRQLNDDGIETLQGDLLDPFFVGSLPDIENVVSMTGRKFGSNDAPDLTWATNVHMPALACEKFRDSRLLIYSTGNVYPFVSPESGGSAESDVTQPVGEYAMSALARERMAEYFARKYQTRVTILRLNYAQEMRYGVLVDLAQRVYSGDTIDLSTGYVNVIWQGDANALALCALADATSPPTILNVAGPECLSVRQIGTEFGRLFERPPSFVGNESDTALLSNGRLAIQRYGSPRVDPPRMYRWIADWIRRKQPMSAKPTHFDVRDGIF